jgi:hypothetical protein
MRLRDYSWFWRNFFPPRDPRWMIFLLFIQMILLLLFLLGFLLTLFLRFYIH